MKRDKASLARRKAVLAGTAGVAGVLGMLGLIYAGARGVRAQQEARLLGLPDPNEEQVDVDGIPAAVQRWINDVWNAPPGEELDIPAVPPHDYHQHEL